MWSSSFFATCCLALLLPVTSTSRVAVGFRTNNVEHVGWTRSAQRCAGSEMLSFTLYLKQQGLDELSAIFHKVSEPSSPSYGHFLTKEAVDKIVFATPDALQAVSDWLVGNGVENFQRRADTIVAKANCSVVSELLDVPFYRYDQIRGYEYRVLFHGEATVPQTLRDHIDFIGGLSELWTGKSYRAKHARSKKRSDPADLKVTPRLLREYYGVPEDETNAAPTDNYQAVVAFDDYFSEDALTQFYQNTDGGLGDAPVLDVMGVECLDDAKPCDQVESDLDVQYMTAMAGRGTVKTLFHNNNVSGGWVLGFSENAQQLSPLPMVFSLSYGWAELRQCEDIGFMVCWKLGYTSKQYVDRTNTNFQKLAVRGASIFVSDGDDGAQGVQASGWNPIDLKHWCGDSPYACYPHTKSSCAEIVLHNTTSGAKCVWPVAHMSPECQWLFLTDFYQDSDIQAALKAANPNCNLDFAIDGSYNTHMYSECTCDQLNSLHHGPLVSEPMHSDTSKRFFYPDFPTSSPYVTSVGATAFKSADGTSVSAEHAASIKDGAIITTGGGFSEIAETPSWQRDAVGQYIARDGPKPPTGTYDATKRGYPDVTLNGHNYQVVYAKDKGKSCPCDSGGVDGTSASSPALAGLISLINGHLLAAGKSQLGFLNPFLYAAHAADASLFKDVVDGDNKCTRDYCMQEGYTAGAGWDPVSGLGSINYSKLKAYALSQAGSNRSEIIV